GRSWSGNLLPQLLRLPHYRARGIAPEARLVPTRANRQPALAVYTRDDTNGLWRGSGLLVITVRGGQVAGLTRFETRTLRAFGLPRTRPDDYPATSASGDS